MGRDSVIWTSALFLALALVACDSDPEGESRDAGPALDGSGGGGPDGSPPGDAGPPESRPSGEVAELRRGEALDVDDARREAARAAFEALDREELETGFDPEALYATFNEFVLTHAGPANQPLIRRYTGDVLDFVPEGAWTHVSRNSATVAFETTVPTRTFLEIGPDESSLEAGTEETERYFFQHVHHLRGLEPATTYVYRLIARGDDGETIVSHARTLTTAADEGFIELPGAHSGPPYVLDAPGTYLLTEDITAPGTAIVIEGAGVTLDLNGHRITYGESEVADVAPGAADSAASGVWGRTGLADVRVLNGFIGEGTVIGNQSTSNGGLNPIYLDGAEGVEIAGVTMDYHAAQLHALFLRYPSGRLDVHHDRFTDRGFQVLDRHGSGGGRPLRIVGRDPGPDAVDDFHVHHNLVARTRQNGLMRAQSMHDNEVYVDSWATNSFAIQPFSSEGRIAGEIRRNKLFLTGYNAIGFGWAHMGLLIADNLVQMEGVSTGERRYYESWGELDSTSAFRITNYGSGGQVRQGLTYRGNVILGRARAGGVMRGTMFYTDHSITGTLFEGNFLAVHDEDGESLDTTPIVTQGVYANRDDHEPAHYVDNEIVSNIANVRFGDSYGRGDRHVFVRPTFRRVGDHPSYHTFVFDAGFDSNRHLIVDPVFEGGAAYDDVWWRRTSVRSYYTIQWTLTITGEASAPVTISDVEGDEVFSGMLDGEGTLSVPLDAVTIRPSEWVEGGATSEVSAREDHQKIWHTPHTVVVGGETHTVEMDEPRSL